jgi:guanyl-specific ribonuclease Sa
MRSKWIAVVAVALLAALAWHSARTPQTVDSAPSASLPAAAPATGSTVRNPLEMPPPFAETAKREASANTAGYPDFLPPEAIDTLQTVARGGPYPYRQDDGVFGNRERRLPSQPRGYYREYTVDTPGSRDRGARRIVTGGRPPVEYFYTDDHYRSFRRFTLDGADGDTAEAR